MEVLLIVGNGFDLNLSLPTAYGDFYDYYLKLNNSKDVNVLTLKNLLMEWYISSNDNQKQIIDWADLELGLGKATNQFDTPSEFLKAFDDIEYELTRYLSSVEKKLMNDFDDIAYQFVDDILTVALLTNYSLFKSENLKKIQSRELTGYYDPKYKNELKSFLANSSFSQDSLHLNIMTFNYTHTIERIVESVQKKGILSEKFSIGDILHIHQDLGEGGIMLGVNDIYQIENKSFRDVFEIKNGFVKPNLNIEYASGVDQKCIARMREANVVILFGVSLGQTDSFWWNKLGKIAIAYSKRIVYCPFETEFDSTHRAIVTKNEYLKRHLLNSMNLTESEYRTAYNLILPIRKNQMFNFGMAGNLVNNKLLMKDLG